MSRYVYDGVEELLAKNIKENNIKENNILRWLLEGRANGQLISKCLFGVFNYPKKREKTIQLEVP